MYRALRFRGLKQGLHNREVVDQRLPAGGRGGDDHILPAAHFLDGRSLVGVEIGDAYLLQGPGQCRWEFLFQPGKPRPFRGKRLVVDELRGIVAVPL